ncbi:MAG: 3-oxoacyl-ACP reductase FabG [Atribacterota bacterium]|nr:3-oxoacyl-ACP reductase FabG [Atribacterota bacterium]
MLVKDKVILITGASRGIGRATAKILAENGAHVIVNYNSSENAAKELVDELATNGYVASMFKADVSYEDEVKKLFLFVKEKYGRIDVLINNAGIMRSNLIMMTNNAEYQQLCDVNCKSVFLCTRLFSKQMVRQRFGKIINTASIMGIGGYSGSCVYSATKSFVIGYTKSCAKELGRYGITVNAVAPGFIETDLTSNTTNDTRDKMMSDVALGRFGTPEDVAKVMLFLSSGLSDYVSGQVIGVDGCESI